MDPVFGWLGNDGCYYKPSSPSPADQAALGSAGKGPGGWYTMTCPGLAGTGGGTVWVAGPPPGQPAGATPQIVARQAVSRLDLPRLPIAMSPPGAQLVGVPTWLWIGAGEWAARSASASIGAVTVTATATPSRVVWSTGDGARVTCTGPGTAWTPGADPAAASPTCGHVYRRSSAAAAGGVFPVTATVSWSIAWAGAGQAGALPELTTSATTSARVDEVRAVVVTG